jgi:hypothetical protein
LLIATAPRLAAALTPVPRSSVVAELTSTRTILQSGHAALTMSRSRAISCDQPASGDGNGEGWPLWLTFLKQPFAVVQAGSPNCERYVARSLSAVGSSNASTTATMWPLPPVEGNPYALRRSLGPKPCGVAAFVTSPFISVRTCAWHRMTPPPGRTREHTGA